MITLSKSGNSVTFTFDENSGYLQNGTIDVPVNSLALITDESDMATFRKSASNDIFISARYEEFGMSKAELEAWYKANMVGSTGGGGGTTYTAGRGIDITNDTISLDLPISAGTGTNSIKGNMSGNVASGKYSHSEGFNTFAIGSYGLHAEGQGTTAKGNASHSEGGNTNAYNDFEHASGQYNISSTASTEFGNSGNTLFSVGNGTSTSARHNAFEIRQNGDIYITSGSTDIKLQDHLGGGVPESAFTAYTAATDSRLAEDEEVTARALIDINDLSENKADVSAVTEIADAISGKADVSAVTAIDSAVSGLTERVGEDEEVTARALIDLDEKKLDASAYTPVDLSDYYTTAQTDSAIDAATSGKVDISTFETYSGSVETALSGKQDTLSAGTNITINGNVISASGGEVSTAITSGDTNPVEGGVLYDELRIPATGDVETVLEWNNYDGGETTNYPSGATSSVVFEVYSESNESNGYEFRDSNDESLGDIVISYNNGVTSVANYNNVTYSISGNVVTVNYPSIAANVTYIASSYDNNWTVKAIVEGEIIVPLIDKVSANTASISALDTRLGGLTLIKLTQSAYDALSPNYDSNTLYVVTDS